MFKHNWACIKLATENFSTVLTRNLQNARDYASLKQWLVIKLTVVPLYTLHTNKVAIEAGFPSIPAI